MKAIFIQLAHRAPSRDFLEWPAIGWPIVLKYFLNRSSVVRLLLINRLWSDSSFVVIPPSHLPTLSLPPPYTTPSPCSHVMSRRCPSADLIPSATVALAPGKRLRRGDSGNCSFIAGKSENLTRSKAVRRLNPWNTKEPCCTLTGFSIFRFVGQPRECDWSFWGVFSLILQLSNVKKFLQLAALNFLGSYYRFSTCFIAVTLR